MWNKENTFDFSLVGLLRISHRYPEIFSQPSQSPSCSVQDSSEVSSFCDEDLSNAQFSQESSFTAGSMEMKPVALYLFCGVLVHTLQF